MDGQTQRLFNPFGHVSGTNLKRIVRSKFCFISDFGPLRCPESLTEDTYLHAVRVSLGLCLESFCIYKASAYQIMHSIVSQWLEIFSFSGVLLKVNLSETKFPQNGHYYSKYPMVHQFCENDTKPWSKDKVYPVLLLDSLKHLTYKGPCFPMCFPSF